MIWYAVGRNKTFISIKKAQRIPSFFKEEIILQQRTLVVLLLFLRRIHRQLAKVILRQRNVNPRNKKF